MSPRVSDLFESSLYVDDLDTSKAFYSRVFGLPVTLEDERMVGLELPGSAVLLLFHRGSIPTTLGGLLPSQDRSGTQHLCLAIPSAALAEWERHLLLHGIVIESLVIQPHGGTSLFFRDPDGHSLEVATPGVWASD